ncbi:tRNA(His) guanylyltransferase Thg1 family protein [Myxococcota bacterium]
MKFDELDSKMRVFETAHDHCALPGLFMVARLDGRGFTRLTKEELDLERPFDVRFRDAMLATVEHLMSCGFRATYGYTESDEISLLLHQDESAFGRKLRKFHSVLAGEASAKASLELGCIAAFDCRISQLPTEKLVVDYFRWRHEDAHRNALNAHCYWALRAEGASPTDATGRLKRATMGEKNELLFQRGTNFNELPSWQKRGMGTYWESFEKEAVNPKTGETTTAVRRRLKVEMELPLGEDYAAFAEDRVREAQGGETDAEAR